MFRCVLSVCLSCLLQIAFFPSFLSLSSRAKVPTHGETNAHCLLHAVRCISSAELRPLSVTMTNNDNGLHQSVYIMASGPQYSASTSSCAFMSITSTETPRKMLLPGKLCKYMPQAVISVDWERSDIKQNESKKSQQLAYMLAEDRRRYPKRTFDDKADSRGKKEVLTATDTLK